MAVTPREYLIFEAYHLDRSVRIRLAKGLYRQATDAGDSGAQDSICIQVRKALQKKYAGEHIRFINWSELQLKEQAEIALAPKPPAPTLF